MRRYLNVILLLTIEYAIVYSQELCPSDIVDILFLIDSSGSVQKEFSPEKELAAELVKDLPIKKGGTHVGVVQFAEKSEIILKLHPPSDYETVVETIENLEHYGGMTNVLSGLKNSQKELKTGRSDANKILLIISDGHSQSDWEAIGAICKGIRDDLGVTIISASKSDDHNFAELELYTGTEELVFLKSPSDIAKLKSLLAKVTSGKGPCLRTTETPTEPPTGKEEPEKPTEGPAATEEPGKPTEGPMATEKPGKPTEKPGKPTEKPTKRPVTKRPVTKRPRITRPTRRPRITRPTRRPRVTRPTRRPRITRPTRRPRTRRPFTRRPRTRRPFTRRPFTRRPPIGRPATTKRPRPKISGCTMDVLFIIDSSGSVHADFRSELSRANRIVDKMNVGPNAAQVALITFAKRGSARTEFPFGNYTTKRDVKTAISKTEFMGGTTAAGDALRLGVDELGSNRGGRRHAKQIVIVFTDGLSQQDPAGDARSIQARADLVYAVSTGRYGNTPQLTDIAGDISRVFKKDTLDKFEDEMRYIFSGC